MLTLNTVIFHTKPKIMLITSCSHLISLSILSSMASSLTIISAVEGIGYKIAPRLASGLGVTYEYYNDKLFDIETSIYGGRIFSNYLIIKDFNEILPGILNGGLFVQAEYEALSLETKHFDKLNLYRGHDRFILHSILVGGGLRFPIGKRASANLLILWNLNETSNTPYSNPVVRLGFNF